MPTIYDVAKLSGLSISTVSRVLNSNVPVSEKSRQRVLSAMAALNYKPNMLSQALSSKENRSVLAVFPLQVHARLSEYLSGMTAFLSTVGYDLLLSFTDEAQGDASTVELEDYAKYLERGLVGGCIFMTTRNPFGRPPLDFFGIPTVFITEYSNAPYPYTVVHSLREPVYVLTNRLIDRGRRRFAFVHACSLNTKNPNSFSEERFSAMVQALQEHGISYDLELTQFCDMNYGSAVDSTYVSACSLVPQYLQLPPERRPDAIICAYDSIALACIHTLQAAGVKIPQEVAVVGFDNSVATSYSRPQITSVQNPCVECGQVAAQLLVGILRGEITTSQQVLVHPKIIERGSTDPALP